MLTIRLADKYDVLPKHPKRLKYLCRMLQEAKQKSEVPMDVRNSKVRKQGKFRRDWSRH